MLHNVVVEYNSLEEINKRIAVRYKENLRKALRKRSLKIKEIEQEEQKRFANELPKLDNTSLFWLGLGLYWAEGAKTERWRAVFYNSDPAINRIMMRFFREICHIADTDMRIQLVLHRNINEEKARLFWTKELSLPVDNFFRASYVLSRASQKKRRPTTLPYGTVQISVRGKAIANKIRGWMLGMRRQAEMRV